MRTNSIIKTVTAGALAFLVGGGVACSTSASASESPYCKAAREWAVHEMTPRDDADPAVFKSYWTDYLVFMEKGVRLSPKPIHDDWATYNAVVAKQTPVLEKYGYSKERMEKEESPAEKALFESPPDDAQAAFHNVLRYEALTCSAGQPVAADVDFSKEKPGEFCQVVAADNKHNAPVFENGAKPDELKAAMADTAYRQKTDANLIRTAPDVIRDDMKAEVAWWDGHQTPAIKKYDYDVRKLLLKGSDKDRRAFQLTDKRIAGQFAHEIAYEQQVCGQGND